MSEKTEETETSGANDAAGGNLEYSEFVKLIERQMDPARNAVLVVDDDKLVRMKVMADIKACDPALVIYEAKDGQDALSKIELVRKNHKRDPLFLVLDLEMPGMSGWDVIEHLHAEYEAQNRTTGIPIIVLSSSTGERRVSLLKKQSVHSRKNRYCPLITVAKENCIRSANYDTASAKGLVPWLTFFCRTNA